MPSILADERVLTEWARDGEFVKFCSNETARLHKQKDGRKKAEAFEALPAAKKMQKFCDGLKKALPFVVFIATYDETPSTRGQVMGAWRKQAACRLNGLCVIDFDHVTSLTPDPSPKGEGSEYSAKEVWAEAYGRLSDEDRERILLVYVTPSGHGLKVVFVADAAVGNLIDNQIDFSRKLGLNPDEACKDASRGAFLTTRDDILLMNEEKLFSYQNEEYGKKYNEQYHHGLSRPTADSSATDTHGRHLAAVEDHRTEQPTVSQSHGDNLQAAEPLTGDGTSGASDDPLTYHGVTIAKIIEAWLDGCSLQNRRHDTLVELADHLRYIIGKNPTRITQVVTALPWVKQLADEGEDVAGTVSSIMGWRYRQNKPDRLMAALTKAGAAATDNGPHGAASGSQCGAAFGSATPGTATPGAPQDTDVYASLPLDEWAGRLQEMAQHYPCMRELFLNVHPHKLPAIWFASSALFGTLMTRAYYHFWYDPELVRRLNYCIFIIGDPGAGKNVIEKFYKKIADPMIQADKGLIDAVNRYKEGRTERTTSSKAQKSEALKRPVVGIRVHPARTATGEFIRHMHAAVETIQDQPLNLHMFSFDAELDNVTKQNKGGDWKDREILELKAFHNEEDGQMYANQESMTGMFNIFWNFIYTGTPYALHRKVNQRNFGTGMSTRLAVIPLPDKGVAKRHQTVDPHASETLSTWAFRLDRVEGELPIEALNDETYDWQTDRLEVAEFNDDRADKTLLKRIPYYGIGISLPYILMRHWDEWQEHRTLTMDERDRQLCRLAMDIQYRCQQFYFGEMAYNYYADQNKELVQHKRTTRYEECFRKLPDEFTTKRFTEVFGCSQQAASRAIIRFQKDGVVVSPKYGVYRKVVSELQ